MLLADVIQPPDARAHVPAVTVVPGTASPPVRAHVVSGAVACARALPAPLAAPPRKGRARAPAVVARPPRGAHVRVAADAGADAQRAGGAPHERRLSGPCGGGPSPRATAVAGCGCISTALLRPAIPRARSYPNRTLSRRALRAVDAPAHLVQLCTPRTVLTDLIQTKTIPCILTRYILFLLALLYSTSIIRPLFRYAP